MLKCLDTAIVPNNMIITTCIIILRIWIFITQKYLKSNHISYIYFYKKCAQTSYFRRLYIDFWMTRSLFFPKYSGFISAVYYNIIKGTRQCKINSSEPTTSQLDHTIMIYLPNEKDLNNSLQWAKNYRLRPDSINIRGLFIFSFILDFHFNKILLSAVR